MNFQRIEDGEWRYPKNTYRLIVHLTPEPMGGFSAILPRLPGVASQGDTIADALTGIREAFIGVARIYKEQQRSIPWLPLIVEYEKPAPVVLVRHITAEIKPC